MTTPVLGPAPDFRDDSSGAPGLGHRGRSIPTPSFAGDDGSAPPRLVAALEAYASGVGGHADVVDALAASRLLVPVVAVLDEAEVADEGVRRDKTSHMATVSTTGRDGRRGLLAFSSVETMRRWDPSARPVPLTARRAAESALADGADALVLDIAGPVQFAIEAADLRALAAGYRSPADTGDIPVWAVAVGLAQPQPEANGAADSAGAATDGGERGASVHVLRPRSRGRGWLSRLRELR